MTIYEHVTGTISVPVYNENGDYAGYTTELEFDDADIIKDSCSITCRACDDTTFSLGGVRPAELSIKLKLEGDGINAYNLYGAKIVLYSCYAEDPKDDDWVFRGTFWVTSVSRTKTIYTLRASDALVWLDEGSYISNSTANSNAKTELDSKLVNTHRTITGTFDVILKFVNGQLGAAGIEEISQYVLPEMPDTDGTVEGIFQNNAPPDPNSDTNICKYGALDLGKDHFSSHTASEYAKDLATLLAGFLTVMQCRPKGDTKNGKIVFIPHGYENDNDDDDVGFPILYVPYNQIAMDSYDVADYRVKLKRVYYTDYNDVSFARSNESNLSQYEGSFLIDLTDNSFLDGRTHGMTKYDDDNNDTLCDNGMYNPYFVINSIFNRIVEISTNGSNAIRPFSLKYYPNITNWKEYPKIGQKVRIEDAKGNTKSSILTKTIWHFRGGWELGCAGQDSRVLSQAAKKSMAKHTEQTAKNYANVLASRLSTAVNNAQSAANAAQSTANAAHAGLGNTNQTAADNMKAIQAIFSDLGYDFTYDYIE